MILLEKQKRITKNIVYVLLFLTLACMGTTVLAVQGMSKKIYQASLENNTFGYEPVQLALTPAPTPSNVINANAALSVEFNEGYPVALFSKNADKSFPVASLTKLMTALIVLERYNLDQKVVISPTAMAEIGEQGVLKLGETLTVKQLLYISLIESSNRAAKALSEVMGTEHFIVLMNEKAESMGLSNTHFEDVTGLSDKSYSSARDIAKLSQYLFKNYALFTEIAGINRYDLHLDNGQLHHMLITTNAILGQQGIVAGKTGWTDEARGCFMVLSKVGDQYFIHIILGSEDRFGEMKKLIQLSGSNQ